MQPLKTRGIHGFANSPAFTLVLAFPARKTGVNAGLYERKHTLMGSDSMGWNAGIEKPPIGSEEMQGNREEDEANISCNSFALTSRHRGFAVPSI